MGPYDENTIECKANLEQVGMIMGDRGTRVKEIRRMSGANIIIEPQAGDNCMRNVKIQKSQYSNDHSLQNAAWLMNICLNAFTEPMQSLIPFSNTTSLQDVVLSEKYGKPPAVRASGEEKPKMMTQQQQQQQQMMMQQQQQQQMMMQGGGMMGGGMNIGGMMMQGGAAGGPMRKNPQAKW